MSSIQTPDANTVRHLRGRGPRVSGAINAMKQRRLDRAQQPSTVFRRPEVGGEPRQASQANGGPAIGEPRRPGVLDETQGSVAGTDLLRRLRSRQVVTRVSYLRELRRVAEDTTQTQLARLIGISQPSVNSALKSAAAVPDVRTGFSGATTYEIAQRYDAGELTREQTVDELGRWSYRPGSPSDGYDWITGDEGEFADVARAHTEHLIDGTMYEEILLRYSEQGR
ncbi:hypothetical protein [Rathayibacter festucae]|uniref:hypothetical protein n=1 Tax=Rathayibacter festucae TaxID=110937 RepID=UPI000FDBD134|nr:hypothetical protein [Rathayibacter festucae]